MYCNVFFGTQCIYDVVHAVIGRSVRGLRSDGLHDPTVLSTATLRSASRPLLHVPRTRTVYGSRAFSVAAPTLWISLPYTDITSTTSLTVFRNHLSTFLFHQTSYCCLRTICYTVLRTLWRYTNQFLTLSNKIIAPALQRVQTVAARLVACLGPRDHVTWTLKDRHWLPIEQRMVFKLCLLMHLVHTGQAPSYLRGCVTA